jgi:hypothetical protein
MWIFDFWLTIYDFWFENLCKHKYISNSNLTILILLQMKKLLLTLRIAFFTLNLFAQVPTNGLVAKLSLGFRRALRTRNEKKRLRLGL